MQHEEEFFGLLENASVSTGNVCNRAIRGWFDTDCEDLLVWLSTHITQENCVSKQHQQEFSTITTVLSDKQLDEEIKSINNAHPQLFELESNLLEIEVDNDLIELLQDQLKEYESQIKLNSDLGETLSQDLKEKIEDNLRSQSELQCAEEVCLKLGKTLDVINSNTYRQIHTLSTYRQLENFKPFPKFINNIELEACGDKFVQEARLFDLESNFLVESICGNKNLLEKYADSLLQSKQTEELNQMEVQGFYQIQSYFETYASMHLMIDERKLESKVEKLISRQNALISELNQELEKDVMNIINPAVLFSLQNDFDHYKSILNNLNNFSKLLEKCLIFFSEHYILSKQENLDSKQFRQELEIKRKYCRKNLISAKIITGKMLDVRFGFNIFSQQPLEKRITFIGDFRDVCNRRNLCLNEMLKQVVTNKNRRNCFNIFLNRESFLCETKQLIANIEVLFNFLVAGPTSIIVAVPTDLEDKLILVNQSVFDQECSIKCILQLVKKLKGQTVEDKERGLILNLWVLYLTNPHKIKSCITN